MTTIAIERELLDEVVELFDNAIAARYPHEILRDLRAALAAPATAPEFPVNWAQMIHYPECWDTAAYPELRDAIHEALAWSGCSVCKPATAPERKPMTKGQREQVARRAEAAMNGNVNLSWRDALISETEAFHDIKETP